MSKARGQVEFKNGEVRFCIYDGSVDLMERQTYSTVQEMYESHPYPSEPTCEHEVEDVTISTTYGHGKEWEGKCCVKCGWIVEGDNPEYEYEKETTRFGRWF